VLIRLTRVCWLLIFFAFLLLVRMQSCSALLHLPFEPPSLPWPSTSSTPFSLLRASLSSQLLSLRATARALCARLLSMAKVLVCPPGYSPPITSGHCCPTGSTYSAADDFCITSQSCSYGDSTSTFRCNWNGECCSYCCYNGLECHVSGRYAGCYAAWEYQVGID
jgi:hypothetical protein